MSGHTMIFTRSVKSGGDTAISKEVTVTSGAKIPIDESVPQNATTLLICSVPFAKIKGLFITSDKAVTLKTNSSGAPDDTFVLAAGGVLEWAIGDPLTNPITADLVAGIYAVVGAVGGNARIQAEILYDPT